MAMSEDLAREILTEIARLNDALNALSGASMAIPDESERLSFRRHLAGALIASVEMTRFVVLQHPQLDPNPELGPFREGDD